MDNKQEVTENEICRDYDLGNPEKGICGKCGIKFDFHPTPLNDTEHPYIGLSEVEPLFEKSKNPVGRPSTYTLELGQSICERIALGESVRSICKEEGMPVISTVMKWLLDEDKALFSEQYEKACNARAEYLFEELLDIADTPQEGVETVIRGESIEEKKGDMLGHRKLQVDTRKWYLSKLMPKKFGDKVDLTSKGEKIDGNTIVFSDFKADETDS